MPSLRKRTSSRREKILLGTTWVLSGIVAAAVAPDIWGDQDPKAWNSKAVEDPRVSTAIFVGGPLSLGAELLTLAGLTIAAGAEELWERIVEHDKRRVARLSA